MRADAQENVGFCCGALQLMAAGGRVSEGGLVNSRSYVVRELKAFITRPQMYNILRDCRSIVSNTCSL